MIEFIHTISAEEFARKYINLKDDTDRLYGHAIKAISPDAERVTLVDGRGRKTPDLRLSNNQLTGLTDWFRRNDIQTTDIITIRFDPEESTIYLLHVT